MRRAFCNLRRSAVRALPPGVPPALPDAVAPAPLMLQRARSGQLPAQQLPLGPLPHPHVARQLAAPAML
jgi:hypothetical protein